MPGVHPGAGVDLGEQPAAGDVVVEHVGDLELAAAGGRQALDHVERVRSQEVDADRDQVRLRLRRLLLEPHDLALRVELRDAEPLRVGDLVQEGPGAPGAGLEGLGRGLEPVAAEDVVAQDDAERVVADEVAGEPDRVRDAEGAALVAIRQLEAEVPAVAQQLDDVTDALAADDDHDLADPHARERVERVVDHRPVVDRQQVLVGDEREREQPARRAARQDESLHRRHASTGQSRRRKRPVSAGRAHTRRVASRGSRLRAGLADARDLARRRSPRELRDARVAAGLSQATAARAAGMSAVAVEPSRAGRRSLARTSCSCAAPLACSAFGHP